MCQKLSADESQRPSLLTTAERPMEPRQKGREKKKLTRYVSLN